MKKGTCFESSVMLLLEHSDDTILVHGEVYHPVSGWHTHAWLECAEQVIDHASTQQLSRDTYYRIGRCRNMKRYTKVQAFELVLKFGHYGPWS